MVGTDRVGADRSAVPEGPGDAVDASTSAGTPTPAEALVERHVSAFNAKDLDALLADFTEDARWVTGDYAVPAGGLRDFFGQAMSAVLPTLTVVRVIDGGESVVAEMTEEWTYEGVVKSAALLAVFDLEEGRIARAKIYREGSADA
ncbi:MULTISPECIES: nuclear transport factor 2 family protein [Brevibacterium]|uniref:SnoaL-like domain-containing protein n=1 Tax=Brevibacterium salitolerans TaxID=1403566 RepID=A0ABN2X2A2_9MICO|nr:nuclear transport factor 2 family protein [Brevibacterium sp.]